MDERLDKALQTANFLASLNLIRKSSFEEFKQSLIFYENGCSFTADLNFISQVSALKQHTNSAIILDTNNIPCLIENLQDFLNRCIDTYSNATNEYLIKYQNIRKQRNIHNLINL